MDRGQSVSTEKKLQLVKLLRSESAQNRMKMKGREELLYGKSSYASVLDEPSYLSFEEGQGEGEPAFSSFKFRLLLAFILMFGFVAWDNGYCQVPGMKTQQVYECLSEENSLTNLFAFMGEIPYTLDSK